MSTGSFIELYLTTFGWNLYDIVWGVITSTGLAFLPIIAAVIDNVVKPIESQDQKSAAITSLKRLEIDVLSKIIIITMAVQPFFTLQFGSVTYSSVSDSKTYTQGSTGTTYDKIFTSATFGDTVTKVPMWFYIVMSVTGGINNAIIARLPKTLDFRKIEHETATAKIHDPILRRDTKRFVTECYSPATADFFNHDRHLPQGYDNDDIGWIGSKYFMNNIYKSLDASSPVDGFTFDPKRRGDMAHYGTGQVLPQNGYPSCYEWWNSPENGLHDRLLKEADPGWLAGIKAMGSDLSTDDFAIRALMKNEAANVMSGLQMAPIADPENYGSLSDNLSGNGYMKGVEYRFGAFFGGIGSLLADALAQPLLYVIKKSAPYVQATFLMAIYFLLPWAIVIGGYEWQTIKTATVAIFAIKFWTTIWAVVGLLDNKLYQSVTDGAGFFSGGAMVMTIIDLLTVALYTILPLFFLKILAWAGQLNMPDIGSSARDMSASLEAGGNKGSDMLRK